MNLITSSVIKSTVLLGAIIDNNYKTNTKITKKFTLLVMEKFYSQCSSQRLLTNIKSDS